MSERVPIPSSKEELTIRHHIAYYTFLPMVVVLFATILASPALWYFGVVSYTAAFAIPWVAMIGFMLYMAALADYIIPKETYKKLRSGEWGDVDAEG